MLQRLKQFYYRVKQLLTAYKPTSINHETTEILMSEKPQKKIVRKMLTIEVTDEKAVLDTFPEVAGVDHHKLRPIVNAYYNIGRPVPGVKAYYASETPKAAPGENQLQAGHYANPDLKKA